MTQRRSSVIDKLDEIRFVFASYVSYIGIAILVAGIFQSLGRCDVFCFSGIIALYAIKSRDRTALLTFLFFLVMSWALDIVWLVIHGHEYQDVLSGGEDAVIGTLQFVAAVTICTMILKAAVFVPAMKHLVHMEPQPSTFLTKTEDNLARAMYGLAFLVTMLSFLNSLRRNDLSFVPMVLLVYALYERRRDALRLFLLLTAVAMVVDATWLGVHTHISEDDLQSVDSIEETEHMVVGLTITTLVVKGVMCILGAVTERAWSARAAEAEEHPGDDADLLQLRVHMYGDSVRERVASLLTFHQHKYRQFFIILSVIQLVLSLFISLGRADVFALCLFIGLFAAKNRSSSSLLVYICLLVLGFIFDLVWFALHTSELSHWSTETGTERAQEFVLAVTLLGTLCKILHFVIAVLLYRSLPRYDPSSDESIMEHLGRYPVDDDERLQIFRNYELRKYRDVVKYICITQLGLFLLNSLSRSDPMGLGAMFGLYALHQNDRYYVFLYVVYMDFTLLIDFLWLTITGSSWEWFDDKKLNHITTDVEKFVWAVSLIAALVKIVCHLPALRYYDDLTKESSLVKLAEKSRQDEEAAVATLSHTSQGNLGSASSSTRASIQPNSSSSPSSPSSPSPSAGTDPRTPHVQHNSSEATGPITTPTNTNTRTNPVTANERSDIIPSIPLVRSPLFKSSSSSSSTTTARSTSPVPTSKTSNTSQISATSSEHTGLGTGTPNRTSMPQSSPASSSSSSSSPSTSTSHAHVHSHVHAHTHAHSRKHGDRHGPSRNLATDSPDSHPDTGTDASTKVRDHEKETENDQDQWEDIRMTPALPTNQSDVSTSHRVFTTDPSDDTDLHSSRITSTLATTAPATSVPTSLSVTPRSESWEHDVETASDADIDSPVEVTLRDATESP